MSTVQEDQYTFFMRQKS